jgi:hypothetical protein
MRRKFDKCTNQSTNRFLFFPNFQNFRWYNGYALHIASEVAHCTAWMWSAGEVDGSIITDQIWLSNEWWRQTLEKAITLHGLLRQAILGIVQAMIREHGIKQNMAISCTFKS